MEPVYIGAGSNLGDRRRYLEQAQALVAELPRSRFLHAATILETEPLGGPPQGKFLNTVWEIETNLSPRELKSELQRIEARLGRRRSSPNAPREIDLDILLYGDQVVKEEGLEIPHPRIAERDFVLKGLAELVPNKMHPKLKRTFQAILEALYESHP